MEFVLPDILQTDLKLVFCGTAPSHKSAQMQAYYAHPSNLFWPTLYAAGFIKTPLQAAQYRTVLHYGIGLTDLNKVQSGIDTELDPNAFDVASLVKKIQDYQPQRLAFTSKNAAAAFFGHKNLQYGAQTAQVGNTVLWVLPSTSGNARPHWQRLKAHWFELGATFQESD